MAIPFKSPSPKLFCHAIPMNTTTPPEITPADIARFVEEHPAEVRAILTIEDQPRADAITGPHRLAAETMGKLFCMEPDALFNSLEAAAVAINGGSLVGVEGTLASAGTTLNVLFQRLACVALEKPRTAEELTAYMKLALRAQAQSANTLEILANLKQGPRVVVTGQLNAANQQVIHNGPEPMKRAKARKSDSKPTSGKRGRALPETSNMPDASFQTHTAKQHAALDA